MAAIRIKPFQGMFPRSDPRYLEQTQAQEAKNVHLVSGALEPWNDTGTPQDTSDTTLNKTGAIQTIYLFIRDYWFHWADDVDVALGPIADDPNERTYFTVNDGDTTPPRVTDASIATAGTSGEWPTNYYTLGVPAPGVAPSVSNSPSCDEADQKTTVYTYTYVNSYGDEGPPSYPSGTVDRCEGDAVSLSNMETGPTGNYDIATKRIYRAVTGADGTDYLFVDEIDVANSTYDDSLNSDDLGEAIPSREWYPPPDDLVGLVMLPNGVAAGFRGQDIFLSEPYLPHAWPEAYRKTANYPVVGLGHFATTAVACTEANPVIIQGNTPESMSDSELDLNQGCVSKRGIVSYYDQGVIYPSPDGLVMIGNNQANVITKGVLSREDWQAYEPSSIHAYVYDGLYFGFYDNGTESGCIVFDPGAPEQGITELDLYATAGYTDALNDRLYLVDSNGDLVVWNEGSGQLTYTWRSAIFVIPNRPNFGAAQVLADSYNDTTIRFYADGQLKHTESVTSDSPFRLPAGFRGREWEIEVEGTDTVSELVMATSMGEIGYVQ